MTSAIHEQVHAWLTARAAAVGDHLVLSTIVLLAMIAVSLLPSLRPRTRYALLFLGVAKFLVPGTVVARLAGSVTAHAVQLPSFLTVEAFAVPASVAGRSELLCVLAAIWIGGTAAIAWRAVAVQLQWREVIRQSTSASARESSIVTRVAGQSTLRHAPEVVRSTAAIPMTAGVIRPVVLLPESCVDELDDDELTAVMAHEVTHVERRHNLAAGVQNAAVALFWFHPALWIARRRLEIEAEEDCDERVLHFADPSTYLSGILKISHGFIAPRPAGASCMSTTQLKERMDHLMKYDKFPGRSIPHQLAIAAGIVAVAVTTVFASAGGPGKASAASVAGKDVTAPKLVSKVMPAYPESAREKRIEGIVIVQTEIDKQGNVTNASVHQGIEGEEGKALGEAAIAAVKQWKFEPALKNGKPVDTKYKVTVRFRLDGDKAKAKSKT